MAPDVPLETELLDERIEAPLEGARPLGHFGQHYLLDRVSTNGLSCLFDIL